MGKGRCVNSKIIITVPYLNNQGGVTSYYNSILPYLTSDSIVPFEAGNTNGKNSLLHPILDQFRFNKKIRKSRPSLVHINPSLNLKSFLRDGIFTWQAKQAGLPVIIFFRGWCKNFETVVENRFRSFFSKTFGRADGFIVLGSEFKEKLREWGVTAPIYIGTTTVDQKLVDNFSIKNKIIRLSKTKNIKILFLARLERSKGIFETVDAVKSLLDKRMPVTLSIAGDGPVRKELEEYTRQLFDFEDSVRYLGYVRDKEKIRVFTEHDIYCLPSYTEGLPNSVLEAMSFGMPVITCPVGGLKDMFEDNKMGLLCPIQSVEEVALALEKMITDKDRIIAMAKYNFQYAKEHFMAPKVARQLRDIYHDILTSSHLTQS